MDKKKPVDTTTVCAFCERSFPDDLYTSAILEGQRMHGCPLCICREINKAHGLPEDTPPHGEQAFYLYISAIEYLHDL